MAETNGKHPSTGSRWDGAGRTFWFSSRLNDKTLRGDERRRVRPEEANIVASRREDGSHMPTLDIDHPAALDPSSTEGHFHLFIDVPMSWRAYRRLLRALYKGGVIGRNHYWRSLNLGATFVRPPGVRKTEEERQRAEQGRGVDRRAATRTLWNVRLRVIAKRIGWNVVELLGLFRSLTGRAFARRS